MVVVDRPIGGATAWDVFLHLCLGLVCGKTKILKFQKYDRHGSIAEIANARFTVDLQIWISCCIDPSPHHRRERPRDDAST